MKETQLTENQIVICDLILNSNQKRLNEIIGNYEKTDKIISAEILKNYELLHLYDPIVLTDKGVKYSTKGILKYIKDKRRDDFLNSIVFKTWILLIPIAISLILGIFNYFKD